MLSNTELPPNCVAAFIDPRPGGWRGIAISLDKTGTAAPLQIMSRIQDAGKTEWVIVDEAHSIYDAMVGVMVLMHHEGFVDDTMPLNAEVGNQPSQIPGRQAEGSQA